MKMKTCLPKRLSPQEIAEYEEEAEELEATPEDENEYPACDESNLHAIAQHILDAFDLKYNVDDFVYCGVGIAVLANLCNAAAKLADPHFYDYKPMLINAATSRNMHCWQGEGIVYIELPFAQVSFHALYEEDEGLPEADGRTWCGIEYQMNAVLVAQAFIEGWSKEALLQVIRLKMECNARNAA